MTWFRFIRRGHFAIKALNLKLKQSQEREKKRDEAILELSRAVREMATTPIAPVKPRTGPIKARSMAEFQQLMNQEIEEVKEVKEA